MEIDAGRLRASALSFIASMRIGDAPHLYRYSAACGEPTLYSSSYAAMTLSLYGEAEALGASAKAQWRAYFNGFQCEDGLFMDPVIYGRGWYEGDPLWCGRPHLTCHVLTALAALGGVAERPISWLEPYYDPDRLAGWLESRQWRRDVSFTGNEVMNVGTLLQYERDFHGDARAARACETLLDWLTGHHFDSGTGLWGDIPPSGPLELSDAVMAAYHFWPLLFYDRQPVPSAERAIDSVLSTQNPNGGFGLGVHNPEHPYVSSACEDIDSIDPLARLMQVTPHRRDDSRKALERAADWVLRNRTEDGGFVFMRDRDFEYGHRELLGKSGSGAMFPTWFRTLSLALLGKALPGHPLGGIPWHFVRCPGYQFWP